MLALARGHCIVGSEGPAVAPAFATLSHGRTVGQWRAARAVRLSVVSRTGGAGGGVIDRPATTPDIHKRKETRRRKPPTYRVLLHNDDYNRREYVVQVLLKVAAIPVDDALNIMQEAHHNGLALVTQCAQDKAEEMCQNLRANGLISTIEPAGPGGAV